MLSETKNIINVVSVVSNKPGTTYACFLLSDTINYYKPTGAHLYIILVMIKDNAND